MSLVNNVIVFAFLGAGLLLVILLIYAVASVLESIRSDRNRRECKAVVDEDSHQTIVESKSAIPLYFSLLLTSIALSVSAFVDVISEAATQIFSFISENAFRIVTALAVVLVSALATYYTSDFLYAFQFAYNLIVLPVRQTILYIWLTIALLLDAMLPVYNFVVVFIKSAISALVKISVESCEEVCLDVFSAFSNIFAAIFVDIAAWIRFQPLNTALDLTVTAASIANFTSAAFLPVSRICQDVQVLWIAIDAPLHTIYFAGMLTSAVTIPISVGQQILISTSEKKTFTMTPVWETTTWTLTNATALADDYVNSFYHIFVDQNVTYSQFEPQNPYSPLALQTSDYVLSLSDANSRRKRPFSQNLQPPAQIPPFFEPIVGNAASSLLSFINITVEAVINTKSVFVRNDGPVNGDVYLNFDPAFQKLYESTQGVSNLTLFLAQEIGSIRIASLGEEELIAEALLFYGGSTIRHGINSVALIVQSIYNSIIRTIYAAFSGNADIYGTLAPIWIGNTSPVFNELRFFSQSVSSIVGFFHEPSGCLLRSSLYLFFDIIQVFFQLLITVINLLRTNAAPTSNMLPINITLIGNDMASLAVCLGNFAKEFSPDCGPFFANANSTTVLQFPCPDTGNNVFDTMITITNNCSESVVNSTNCTVINATTLTYNAFCDASFTLPSLGENCCDSTEDIFCAIGFLLQGTSELIFDIVLLPTSVGQNTTTVNQRISQQVQQIGNIFANFSYTAMYSISDEPIVTDLAPVITSLLNITVIPLQAVNALLEITTLDNGNIQLEVVDFIFIFIEILLDNLINITQSLANWCINFSTFLEVFFAGLSGALSAIKVDFGLLVAKIVQFTITSSIYFFSGQWGELIATYVEYIATFDTLVVEIIAQVIKEIWTQLSQNFLSPILAESYVICIIIYRISGKDNLEAQQLCSIYTTSPQKRMTTAELPVDPLRYAYDNVLIPNQLLTEQRSSCGNFFNNIDYQHTLWQDLSASDKYIFQNCFEKISYAHQANEAAARAYSHATPLPLSTFYDYNVLWDVTTDLFRALFVRTEYWSAKLFYSNDTLHSDSYMNYCNENNLSMHTAGSLMDFYRESNVQYGAHAEALIEFVFSNINHAVNSLVKRASMFKTDISVFDSAQNSTYSNIAQKFVVAFQQSAASRTSSESRYRTKRFAKRNKMKTVWDVLTAAAASSQQKSNARSFRNYDYYMRTTKIASTENRRQESKDGQCTNCRILNSISDIIINQTAVIAEYYDTYFMRSFDYYTGFYQFISTGNNAPEQRLKTENLKNGLLFFPLTLNNHRLFNKTQNELAAYRGQPAAPMVASNSSQTTTFIDMIDSFISSENTTLAMYVDQIISFLVNPNASSNESALYYVNAALTCNYRNTLIPSDGGVGITTAILAVITVIILLFISGIVPQFLLALIVLASPLAVLFFAYFFSPFCFPALPVYAVDDISALLNISLPQCVLQDAAQQDVNVRHVCAAFPPRQTFYTASQVGFDDWQDNVVFAIETYVPGFANQTLASTSWNFTTAGVFYPIARLLLTNESLVKFANLTQATPTQILYFYLTLGHVLVFIVEVTAITFGTVAVGIPLIGFLIFAIGNVIYQAIVFAVSVWSATQLSVVDNADWDANAVSKNDASQPSSIDISPRQIQSTQRIRKRKPSRKND